MAIYNVHGGHSLICRGASGLLEEVNEDRAVKNKVIEYLRKAGHTVYDCTDDNGRTQGANLSAIVAKCNAHKASLDVSIHLNTGGGTGCEVENYDTGTKAVSDRICANISAALGIRNRGTKYMPDLYVLRNTKSPAILVECCFVDNAVDKVHWNVEKCAKAIAEGIVGHSINVSGSASSKPSATTVNGTFKVRVDATDLNIRKGPGTNYSKTGKHTGKGTFTIAETKSGAGSAKGWGKLKSGAGWISLDFAKRV